MADGNLPDQISVAGTGRLPQRGDRPDNEGLELFPQNHHEPYYVPPPELYRLMWWRPIVAEIECYWAANV